MKSGPSGRRSLGGLLLAVALATSAAAREPAVHGLDVSHHSGTIDWLEVREQGVDFVYLKATEGVDAADPMFDAHWQWLGDLGIARGAYHFYVTEDDPEAQAEFFLSRLRLEPGDLRPVVDIEVLGHGTQPGLADRLRQFLTRVRTATGVTPVIYTSPRFWNEHLGEGFEHHPLWVAEYEVEAPAIPEGWTGWTIWQFAGDVEIEGIEKGADRSRLAPGTELDSLRVTRSELTGDP